MNKRILLCVDAELSPITQHALRTIGEFVGQEAPRVRLVLLHVIPLTQAVATHPGMYVGQMLPVEVTALQRSQAEEMLRKARGLLLQQGVELGQVETMVRVGVPADEIVRVARESGVSCIVVGSHGESFRYRLRRFLAGSVSHRVMRLAPCPVMVVAPVHIASPENLVAWYQDALKRYLDEHRESLAVFTPERAAVEFAPPGKLSAGHKEIAAAAKALERLAHDGKLCKRQVQGELKYVND